MPSLTMYDPIGILRRHLQTQIEILANIAQMVIQLARLCNSPAQRVVTIEEVVPITSIQGLLNLSRGVSHVRFLFIHRGNEDTSASFRLR